MSLASNFFAAAALGALCTSCALHEVKRDAPQIPVAFAGGSTSAQPAWPSKDWYDGFANAELSRLVAEASSHNLDLAMARARVVQADARARQAGAAILPAVDAGANGNFLAGHSSNGSAHETDWSALLSASYEIDFWGKTRAASRAAGYRLAAARADHDTVGLTTLAGVAGAYFQLLSVRERLAIARANLDTAHGLLDVVQKRFGVGMANPLELATQGATSAIAGLVIPELQQQETEALAALAVLVGQMPEDFALDGSSLDSVTEPAVAAGLPAALLTRRPDVLMAEANLQAADADLVVARAALLPSVTLTAGGGVQNPALNAAVTTLAGMGPTLSVGASLVQTIFDNGKLRAIRAEAQARDEELVAAYRSAILAALVDVEKSLSALRHLNDAREFQKESVVQSERAFEGATLRYQSGSGDFLTLLEAQRAVYSARDQYSQYKLARLQALVSLCKALGGGWQASTP